MIVVTRKRNCIHHYCGSFTHVAYALAIVMTIVQSSHPRALISLRESSLESVTMSASTENVQYMARIAGPRFSREGFSDETISDVKPNVNFVR